MTQREKELAYLEIQQKLEDALADAQRYETDLMGWTKWAAPIVNRLGGADADGVWDDEIGRKLIEAAVRYPEERPHFSPEVLEIARRTGVGNEQVLREVIDRFHSTALREAAAQALGALYALAPLAPSQEGVERVIKALTEALS